MTNHAKTKPGFFDYDGTFYDVTGKIFDVMIATIYWMIGCIPLITIGASCAALYRTCSHSIRRDIGTVTKEFWHSFSINFRQGFFLELICGGAIFLMLWNVGIVEKKMPGNIGIAFLILYSALFVIALVVSLYCFPALSRFNGETGWFVKLGIYLTFRHLPTSLLLAVLFGLCCFGIYIFLPLLLILPGAYTLLSTYLLDPILDQHMPEDAGSEISSQ